jgi:hypothetical protein
MGAEVFYTKSFGKTNQQAFKDAVEDAYYQFGHDGYTGSIAEKDSFVMINLPEGKDPEKYADELIDAEDPRIDDKWGPAGCFYLGKNEYFFFGWASS